MIRAIVFDFSRVFLFPKDKSYLGELNALHRKLSSTFGYVFEENFQFNKELLEYIQKVELNKKFNIYIFTSGTIQDTYESREFLNGLTTGIFSAERMGVSKKDPVAYKILAESLGLQCEEILFVDDLRENTLAAENCGMKTLTYRNNMQFETEITPYLRDD